MPRTTQEKQTPIDEIDLRQLFLTIWKSKALILIVTLIATLVAVAYATFATPTYKALAIIAPPAPADLAAYNLANDMLHLPQSVAKGGEIAAIPSGPNGPLDLTPDTAYHAFLAQLQSATLRQAFFNKVYLPDHPDDAKSPTASAQLRATLNQQLSIQVAEPPSAGTTTVSLQGRDPTKTAAWLNQYVAMARAAAHDKLVTKLKVAVDMRLQEIDHQAEGLRVVAAAERRRNLRHLEDALKIAQSLQLTKPLSAGNLVASYEGPATYLRGSDALQAEIGLLKARAGDDDYIPHLPELLYARHLLRAARINPEPLSVVAIEQPALPPTSPIQPRKELIIVLGIFLGIMIGTLVALFRQKMASTI